MIKKHVLFCLITLIFLAKTSVPVKADMVTASQQIPTLKVLYHVNDAESDLKSKTAKLNALINSGASACDIASAQAEVNESTLIFNTLNQMVINETMITAALPAPGACSQSVVNNALLAQAAWTDYINKAKAAQATLNYSYAGNIIASNQDALIAQASFAHLKSPGNSNPVSLRATANWAAVNQIISDKSAYALAATVGR